MINSFTYTIEIFGSIIINNKIVYRSKIIKFISPNNNIDTDDLINYIFINKNYNFDNPFYINIIDTKKSNLRDILYSNFDLIYYNISNKLNIIKI